MKIFKYVSFLLVFLSNTVFLDAMSSRPIYVTPSDKYHIVQPGETLYSISRKCGISVQDLKLYNNLSGDKIEVGQKIYYSPRDPLRRNAYITQRKIPENRRHIVQKGESLTIIAEMYDLDLLNLLHYNEISDWELKEGQTIYLAEGMLSEKDTASIPDESPPKVESNIEKDKEVPLTKTDFISPLYDYKISKDFNKKERHQGIDLAAPAGSPVYAVKAGTVIYAGTQKGYGNMIIIEHADRVMTVYAHNENNMVEAGDKVKQGEQIATVGKTGRASGNHLHFELRKAGLAIDPKPYIFALGR